MKKYILLTLLTGSSFYLKAQKISGTITDKEDGKVLPFASISVKGTSKGTNANNQGQFILHLSPGTYTLVCQHVGFKKEEKAVTVSEKDIEINFVLTEQDKELEKVIVSTKSDAAYEIIRKAIEKKQLHKEQVKKFQCEVYTKGNLKVRNYPKKILGQKVDFEDGDTSKQKMIYLSETISTYSVDEPGKSRVEVVSSKVSGQSDAYGLSAPQYFSFYNENILIGEGINPRGFVSPLADNAISFYRFRYKGAFVEDGILVNKIQVLPRRKYEPLFTGFINIVDEDWSIHSLKLELTKQSQMDLVDTLRVEQLYEPVNKNVWVIKNQVIYPSIKILGFDAYGNFINAYSKFDLNPSFNKNHFSSTVTKYQESSNKKTPDYWETARPLPLMADEVHDYKRKDSLELARTDPKYRDSLDKNNNKISLFNTMLFGKTFVATAKRTSLTIQPLPEIVSFNIVEGLVLNTGFSWTKQIGKNINSGRSITLSPNFRYGFLNNHFNTHLTARYNFGTKYPSSVMLSGGKRVFQFNNGSTIGPRRNTISTLLSERNLLLLYEAWYVRGSFTKGIGNGFTWTAAFQFQDRLPLDNHSNYTWYKKSNRAFTPNYPVELMNDNIKRHQVLTTLYRITWQPGSKYIELPERKINIGSKYPVFSLQYLMAIKNLFGSDEDFSKWKLTITDDLNFRLQGKLSYRIGAGGFINKKNIQVPDYNHFNGNTSHFASEYLNSFQLLPLYDFSNTEKLYGFGHIEHHFNGFLTNKIPVIRKWNIHLVAGANIFYHRNANYYEIFGGFENIFKRLRIDFVQSFLNGKLWMGNIRIGMGRSTPKERDDWP
jgi:hypothetical protein